jgi:hypothetical protein
MFKAMSKKVSGIETTSLEKQMMMTTIDIIMKTNKYGNIRKITYT